MTADVQMDETGAIRLPEELRKALGFEPGAPLIAESHDGGLFLRPSPHDQTRTPIWETIASAAKKVPQEVRDRLPKDGAEQHDHYIYGTPKRSE